MSSFIANIEPNNDISRWKDKIENILNDQTEGEIILTLETTNPVWITESINAMKAYFELKEKAGLSDTLTQEVSHYCVDLAEKDNVIEDYVMRINILKEKVDTTSCQVFFYFNF